MMRLFGIALGAGVTSAALIAAATTRTPAGLALAALAPLPIMIAGLGFPPAVGAAAAVVCAGVLAALTGPLPGALFFVFFALPAWLLSDAAARARTVDGAPAPGWTPVATLVLALVAAASGLVLLAGTALVWRFGGYERTLARASRFVTEGLSASPLTGDVQAATVVQAAPVSLAVTGVLVFGANLWLAGRAVQLSGWLRRPWPNLPDGLRLPRATVAVLALLGAALLLPPPLRLAAAVVAGALGVAFAFEGLAAAHVMTRGLSARGAILAAIYLACGLLMPLPLVALALLGCIDCLVPALRRGSGIRITKVPKRRQ